MQTTDTDTNATAQRLSPTKGARTTWNSHLKLLFRIAVFAVLISLIVTPDSWQGVFTPLNDEPLDPIYRQEPLWRLTLWHLALSIGATVLATVFAVTLALSVTRPTFSRLKPLALALVRLGQTIPPVVVLALVIPWLGFGNEPTLLALFLYGLLPIFERSLTAITQLPRSALEAADGVGLSPSARLFKVELPLALPTILDGVRLSLTINIGTATLGSTVAAKSLGEVILAGLLSNNNAYIAEGAVITGLLAMVLYDWIGWALSRLYPPA